jgi:hypothetical protein
MEIERFVLLPDPANTCSEIILSKVTEMKIKVYFLQKVTFKPNPKEVQLYAENRGVPLAFETAGLSVKNGLDMLSAIKWYALQKFNYPEMQIVHRRHQNV